MSLPREVFRWLQRLDLTYAVQKPRWDLRNGYLVGEIISRYHPDATTIESFSNGTSKRECKINWEYIERLCEKLKIPLTRQITQGMLDTEDPPYREMITTLYSYFTGQKLPETTKVLPVPKPGVDMTAPIKLERPFATTVHVPSLTADSIPARQTQTYTPSNAGTTISAVPQTNIKQEDQGTPSTLISVMSGCVLSAIDNAEASGSDEKVAVEELSEMISSYSSLPLFDVFLDFACGVETECPACSMSSQPSRMRGMCGGDNSYDCYDGDDGDDNLEHKSIEHCAILPNKLIHEILEGFKSKVNFIVDAVLVCRSAFDMMLCSFLRLFQNCFPSSGNERSIVFSRIRPDSFEGKCCFMQTNPTFEGIAPRGSQCREIAKLIGVICEGISSASLEEGGPNTYISDFLRQYIYPKLRIYDVRSPETSFLLGVASSLVFGRSVWHTSRKVMDTLRVANMELALRFIDSLSSEYGRSWGLRILNAITDKIRNPPPEIIDTLCFHAATSLASTDLEERESAVALTGVLVEVTGLGWEGTIRGAIGTTKVDLKNLFKQQGGNQGKGDSVGQINGEIIRLLVTSKPQAFYGIMRALVSVEMSSTPSLYIGEHPWTEGRGSQQQDTQKPIHTQFLLSILNYSTKVQLSQATLLIIVQTLGVLIAVCYEENVFVRQFVCVLSMLDDHMIGEVSLSPCCIQHVCAFVGRKVSPLSGQELMVLNALALKDLGGYGFMVFMSLFDRFVLTCTDEEIGSNMRQLFCSLLGEVERRDVEEINNKFDLLYASCENEPNFYSTTRNIYNNARLMEKIMQEILSTQ